MRLSAVLFLAGATLIDPHTHTVEIAGLLVKDGKVVSHVALGSEATVPKEAIQIDLKGKFVMPGLVDLHVHSWGNDSILENGKDDDPGHAAVLARMLYCGVVAALDLGSDPDEIFPLRDKQRANPESVPGAFLFAAGPVLGAWVLKSPDEARHIIHRLAKRKPDVVKLMYDHVGRDAKKGMNRAIFSAAAGEAKKLGLKTVVHIGSWDDAANAVEGGASAITHLFDSEEIPEKLARRMKELGVVEIPTMAVQGDLYRVTKNPAMLEDPLLKNVTPSWFLSEFAKPQKQWKSRARRFFEWQKADIPTDYISIKRLYGAGVELLAGSDAANFATFQGYSAHREIQILNEAGLSAWDALAAGTTRAAAFLGHHYGVAPGDEAELVILGANPVEAVGRTEKVEGVLHLGRYWGPSEREKLKGLMRLEQ